jgi:serine/threonine-protein kinase
MSSGASDKSASLETFVAERTLADFEERRRNMERLFLVGCIAWPAFFLHDMAGIFLTGDPHDVGWFAGLRALGETFALPCYFLMRKKRASGAMITVMDYATFGLGGALLAVMALRLGGLQSRHMQGVMIFVFARCTVLPLPWRRAIAVPTVCAFAYPATLGLLSVFLPELRAQWSDRAALGAFIDNFLFVLAGLAVGIFASHLIDTARKQVFEARKLGNYRLKVRIGRGGVGEVWLARQLTLDRDVALKVLREQATRSSESIRRFQREARVVSKLEHPNTIKIIDFGASDDGVLYIAMELLQGMDLDAMVDLYGPLPPSRAIHLARQACGSLGEAHARGILHRDVKPANLFVAEVGREHDVVKVLDFGVARFAEPEDGASLTETGALTGTPDYMPPEICAGDTLEGSASAVGAPRRAGAGGSRARDHEVPREGAARSLRDGAGARARPRGVRRRGRVDEGHGEGVVGVAEAAAEAEERELSRLRAVRCGRSRGTRGSGRSAWSNLRRGCSRAPGRTIPPRARRRRRSC